MKPKKSAPEKVEVRMPGELRAKLTEAAERDDRSTNQQAVHYIKRGLEADGNLLAKIESLEAKIDGLVALLSREKGGQKE